MTSVLIIDGQGGKIGAFIVEKFIKKGYLMDLLVIGTNAIATQAMMKAGANQGATGENPVRVYAAKADIIICPVGLMIKNALYGEVTPVIHQAIMDSPAEKIIIPFSQCGSFHFVTESVTLSKTVDMAIATFEKIWERHQNDSKA